MQFMTLAVVLGLMVGTAGQAADKPLKVFILAGQSNMQGHAQDLDVRFHGRGSKDGADPQGDGR